MLFNRSKSIKKSPKEFYIGNVPTRPGRRQIDLESVTTEDNNTNISRIGDFNMTTGYHPVRPAIMTNTETGTKSTAIQPFNTNHILPVTLNKHRRFHFLHRHREN
jgi:hypothetical protein